MEDWQKNLVELIETMTETVADEVDRFFSDVTEVIDMVATASEQVASQLQQSITMEFDNFLNEVVEPVFEVYIDFDEISFENEWPMLDSVEPSPEQHPACMGCRHYHGQVYSGNILVCGMHPYGWDDKNCPDWEGFGS